MSWSSERIWQFAACVYLSLGILAGLFAAIPTASAAQTAGAGAVNDYRLGVGDRLRITVHGEDDLTIDARIEQIGSITYPFLGEIPSVGLTVSELERRITQGLRGDYLLHPEVRVLVVEYRKFYVLGQVKLPGGYSYTPGLTVRKAATLAGGFTDRASSNKIFLMRENDPKQDRLKVDMDAPVGPGDTVMVEEGLF
jgi:polysaccharide export outer membrane protein